ncbi:hypothetical protein B0J11DRAFT_618537 [Dendryphion nanum]|uniref:RGS domain-containing protein n=1 Tax=Dendryphion nanum TaxID=256645 RepID=A0A9P9ICV9_9PLEO|nr:hypothetical protein B0J11DRAFT_618537 [Dendryphion nanum]
MDISTLTIYNLPASPPNWDKVGVFYISYAAIWTTVVLAGMAFCLHNRHLPILRIRGLPLSFGSVFFLHLYWIMAQITYPIGRTLPLVIAYDVQYFVMGMWLPLGIALFHAANLRFLRVAKLQKQFTHPDARRKRGCDGEKTSWFCKIRNMEYTQKVLSFIVTGMVIQCILCIGMWLACKKYHPSFGIPGTEIRGATLPEQLIDLGRGWEWWPSVLWQLIWTWMVAPVLIWRAWGINDTMGWRTQTIGACLSGLHATPMFLIASYVPVFNKINVYFTPSQWIHLNTMFIEIFTVFVPVFQVIKLRYLRKQVTINEHWETDSQAVPTHTSDPSGRKGSAIELIEKNKMLEYITEHNGDRLLTMNALNRVLDEHPVPLQEFSAHHDFSGENIAFLTRVSKLKTSITPKSTKSQDLDIYNEALNIYINFISPRTADFPLNLSSRSLKALESIFEASATSVCGGPTVDPALPFLTEVLSGRQGSQKSDSSGSTLHSRYTGDIPGLFHPGVFDEAQSHIKSLVLTNTWPKFVREMQMRQRRESEDSDGSGFTDSSDATIVSRITMFIRRLA